MMTGVHLSEKVRERMTRPRHRGGFDGSDATGKGLVLVKVKVETVTLTALVDPETRTVYDARFFTYGAPLGVGVLDAYVEMAKGRTLDEVQAITPEAVERFLRDEPSVESTDAKGRCFFDVVPALSRAMAAAWPAALAQAEAERAVRQNARGLSAAEELGRQVAEFVALPREEQIRRVEEVLDEHVRPGLAMDGGGLYIDDVKDGREVVVTYLGTCGGCGISSGATLGYIEMALRSRLHDEIRVVPTNATSWAF